MNKCRGFLRPYYRTEQRTFKNNLFGVELPKDNEFEHVNTKDEFLSHNVLVEDGEVCVDCKKRDCSNGTEQKENDVK